MEAANPLPEPTGPAGSRFPQAWLGIAEAMGVLLACAAAIVLVSALEIHLLAPRIHQIDFVLVDDPLDGRQPTPPGELLRRLDEEGIDARSETFERRGESVLRVGGLGSVDGVETAVQGVLVESGYEATPGTVRSTYDAEAFIVEHARLTLGVQALLLIAFGATFHRLRRRSTPGRSERAAPVHAALTGLAAGAAGFVCALGVTAIQYLLGWSVEEQPWLQQLLRDREALVALLPYVVVLVPFAEEVFFRGYMFRFLLERSGPLPAYLLSAGCFGLIHLHLPGFPTYFIVGLLFAAACRRTSTLLAPVVGHMTYNGLAVAFSLLTLDL